MTPKGKLTRRQLDAIRLENESLEQIKTRITVQIFIDDWLKIDRLTQGPRAKTKSEFIRELIHNTLKTMEIPKYTVQ